MSSLLFSIILIISVIPPISPSSSSSSTSPSDIHALSSFLSSIHPSSIPPFSCLSSWNFSSDPCHPSTPSHFLCALSCSSSSPSRITSISLDPAGYSSSSFPLSLLSLPSLSLLSLSSNSFSGPLPPSLPSLSSLSILDLSHNSFSGPIPPSLSSLSSLSSLDLSHNSFSGSIPPSLSSLSSLSLLDLSFNHLSGPLPPSLPPNLLTLALKANSLSDPIKSSTFRPLTKLEVAELSSNSFTGALGAWFLLLPSLQQVDLSNNSLTSLEVSAGAGESLVAVDLSYNRIEGGLPVGLAAFPALAALSLRHNRLRGGIPAEYYGGKKGTPFRRLFLDGNFLNGRVPAGFLGKGAGAGEVLTGSFGDNCLASCPASVGLCSPVQKPASVCKQAYGSGRRGS
ncbi:hypothetical protein J5N97_026512 [Dioscorea zingiberensis]|uniref:Uncharacterized protein n=1 Tax=Dioscorea zingiberensis TaxID=325984 RepID=A0A9D5H6S1_9LILI|nr:hypothetical protein J5N97_026512 [Dioscorea zingiberensis]